MNGPPLAPEVPEPFAEALIEALGSVPILFETYNRVREYSLETLDLDTSAAPDLLPLT